MKAQRRNKGIALLILNLGAWCMRVANITFQHFTLEKEPWYPLNRQGGPHSPSGQFRKETSILFLPELELQTVQAIA